MRLDEIILDCHGYRIQDVKWLCKFIDNVSLDSIYNIEFITGVGSHSQKKPIMDYYCAKTWKNPINEFIHSFCVNTRRGARIETGYGYIKLRRSTRKILSA
jgi:hypothetical protein